MKRLTQQTEFASPDAEASSRLTDAINREIAGDLVLEDLIRRIAERGARTELAPLFRLTVRASGIVADVRV